MKKKITCILALFCCIGICTAQQVLSSGGYAIKSDVSVNWILGGSLSDMPVIDLNALNKICKEQLTEQEISFKVYPVPATDFLNIEITPIDTGRFSLELYNSSGVRVINKIVPYQPIMQVNVDNIPSGIYLLKVFQPSIKNQLPRVEKVIKY